MFNDKFKYAAVAATDAPDQETALLSSLSSRKQAADACRELARIATKESVPKLAALLGDPEQSHMARYALETIPDPSVDDAFRDALGKVKGLQLTGVIGSIGVRRDTKAIPELAKFLTDADTVVAQAAARALGSLGTVDASEALMAVLDQVPAENRFYVCEGLFRCAEALGKQHLCEKALGIYNRVRALKEPHQLCTAALRGAVLVQGEDGIPLLLEALRGEDYTQAAAAAHIAFEMNNPHVNKALADAKGSLSADKQELLKQAVGI